MNMVGKLFAWLQGRTTGFLIGFFTIGNVLQWLHRLDASYISFMVAFMGCVVGHSIKEDYFSKQTPAPDAAEPDEAKADDATKA
jgi:hypothetical protein